MSAACDAARLSAALFELSRDQIELTGRDRAEFLHNFCTNDIKSLRPGQGCEAFLCNVKGRVLGHVTVFVDADSIWLDTVAGAAPGLIAHLDRYLIREDVQLHDRTAEVGELHLIGPQAIETLASLLNSYQQVDQLRATWQSLHPVGTTLWTVPNTEPPLRIRAVDWFGEPAYLLTAQRWLLDHLWAEARRDRVVAGTEADWQALRIATGFPQYGVDLTDDHLPQEAARTKQCISFTKGCYLGQEPIARLDAMGHTNRELRRVRLPECAPMLPAALTDPTSNADAGTLTSCTLSPDGEGYVGLGMIKTKWQPPGTRLTAGSVLVTVE